MFWTLLALLLWIVLGGFISYYGDLQGRRWGKKRISKFGLRPKHFAILITSITGGVISLLSVVTLLLIMPPVRDVIFNGERAIRENKEQTKKTNQDQELSARQLGDIRKRLGLYEAQVKEARGQLDPLLKQTEALRSQNAILMTRKAELQTRATALQQQVLQQEAAVQQAQKKIASLNHLAADLKIQNDNAAVINFDLAKDNIDKSRENGDLKRSLTDLQADITGLQKTKTELTAQIQTLQASYAGIDAAYHKLLDANTDASRALETEIAKLKQERDDLTRQREQLYTEIAGNSHDFAQTYLALRGTKLALRAGGELARLTINPNESPENIRVDLNTLLDRAAAKANVYGATRGENGREVAIIPKRRLMPDGSQNDNEEASLKRFTQELTARDYPTTVVAYVVYNSMAGEPALIDLNLQKITPVYATGDTVATRRIDVRRATDEIFGDVLSFLKQDVRDAAIRKGVLAQIDPRTGLSEVGVASYSDLFRITEQVRRMGGAVKISAIARHGLTSADPVDVELRAERIPKPGAEEISSEALRSRN